MGVAPNAVEGEDAVATDGVTSALGASPDADEGEDAVATGGVVACVMGVPHNADGGDDKVAATSVVPEACVEDANGAEEGVDAEACVVEDAAGAKEGNA